MGIANLHERGLTLPLSSPKVRGAGCGEGELSSWGSVGRRRRQRALVATGGEPRGVATVSLDELLDRGFAGGAVNDDVSERFDAEDLRGRVESALACLPVRQREVLARYYGDSLTLREAGVR